MSDRANDAATLIRKRVVEERIAKVIINDVTYQFYEDEKFYALAYHSGFFGLGFILLTNVRMFIREIPDSRSVPFKLDDEYTWSACDYSGSSIRIPLTYMNRMGGYDSASIYINKSDYRSGDTDKVFKYLGELITWAKRAKRKRERHYENRSDHPRWGNPEHRGGQFIDELERLATLRQRGALSDDEFQRAKAKLLDGAQETGEPEGPEGKDEATDDVKLVTPSLNTHTGELYCPAPCQWRNDKGSTRCSKCGSRFAPRT